MGADNGFIATGWTNESWLGSLQGKRLVLPTCPNRVSAHPVSCSVRTGCSVHMNEVGRSAKLTFPTSIVFRLIGDTAALCCSTLEGGEVVSFMPRSLYPRSESRSTHCMGAWRVESDIYWLVFRLWKDYELRRLYSIGSYSIVAVVMFNPLKPELNPICYLLALLAHHFLHVSRIRVKSLTLRLVMSYIYGAPILDVSRSHTTTQHSR